MKKRIKIIFSSIFVALLCLVVRLIRCTYRIKVIDKSGTLSKKMEPIILTLWHNRLLFGATAVPRYVRTQFVTIASLSNDGKVAAKFVESFGLKVIRGSSSKGGPKALLNLYKTLEKQKNPVVITIDGPRGPRYTCKPGAIYLSEKTAFPIVPYVANASKYWQLRNWDKTQIPKPFSKIELIFGEKIYLNAEQTSKEKEKIVVDAMLKLTKDL